MKVTSLSKAPQLHWGKLGSHTGQGRRNMTGLNPIG